MPPSTPPGARVLLRNADGAVHVEAEGRLVATCDGRALDHVIGLVTTFAFVVSAIVGALAVARVAPLPVGLVAAGWIVAGAVARGWADKRRLEHGRFVVDFDAGRVTATTRSGTRELPLDAEVVAEISDPEEADEHPRWLLLRRGGDRLRLAHGRPEELRPVLYELRRHGVRAPPA